MIVRDELVLFGFTSLILLYLAAVGIYYCENQAQPDNFSSVFDSHWWADGWVKSSTRSCSNSSACTPDSPRNLR